MSLKNKKIIIWLLFFCLITLTAGYLFYNGNKNVPTISDFLGSWTEVTAGRIYVEINKKDNKIEVVYGGANSAYSHSESKFECDYDKKTGSLVSFKATHTEQFLSCNGYSYNDNMEKFFEYYDKNPDLVKDEYKTYTDNKKRVIKIKKGTKDHFIVDDEQYMDEEKKNEIKQNYENMGLYFEDDKDSVFYKYKG